MKAGRRLSRSFFAQPTLCVAQQLLGKRLVRIEDGKRLAGIILETEVYRGEDDLACHARFGQTPRTAVMYGPPGYTYIYFNYGMHWLLNFVTETEGFPAAVLIRSIRVIEGLDLVAPRRKRRQPEQWTDGPAKICQALNIHGELNGADLCASDAVLFVEMGIPILDSAVTTGPRVGLNKIPEPWKSMPWRFRCKLED